MRKLRDVFYINAFPQNKEVVYYGLEFKDFIRFLPVELRNILLLESEYYGAGYKVKYKLETVNKEEMQEFLKEDICGYGNFCWVDYNELEDVKSLEPFEVAELLYLGHMFSPVKSPFFDKLQNKYAYLAHDDGWFYYKNYEDIAEIIGNKAIDMVSTSKRRKIYPMSNDLKIKLLSLAEEGLLLDFSNILKLDKSIELPIYTIGKFLDMDEMYNDLKRHIGRARYSAKLVHKKNGWTIEYAHIKQ